MSEWKKVKLGEICESISDGDHLPPPKVKRGIPFITISNIDSTNHIDFSDTLFVPQEYYDKINDKRKARTGDILYSVVGSFGKPVLIKSNRPFVFQRHIAILRPDNKEVDSAFMYYTMMSYDFFMQADSVALGAAQRTISLSSLRNMVMLLPSLDEQKRISGVLSRYDSLIENHQRQIKLLEEAAQRLYKEWFVDLHFPGYENTKIVDGVPEGWKKKSIKELALIIRGKSYSSSELSDNGVPMVNLKNIQPYGGYKPNAEKHFNGDFKDTQTLQKGDLIMGVTDMTKERRLVGSVALVPYLGDKITFSMDIIKIVSQSVPLPFLYCSFRFGGLSRKISMLANGVNVLHLKPQLFANYKVLIPSDNIIERFTNVFNHYQELIWKHNAQIRLLTEARDRLLPKLMSGEMEV